MIVFGKENPKGIFPLGFFFLPFRLESVFLYVRMEW